MAPIYFGWEQRKVSSFMCGIVGLCYLHGNQVPQRVIEHITKRLSHRGPDGCETKSFGSVAFGHCRLSIIDLATGTQPISNENEKIWITFNGEIYNYLELRDILRKKGHYFKTNSDTEVIIHSYEEWGKDCVTKLRGMFAFALYDIIKMELFLARDQFGIKPLFYLDTPRVFAFGSEIQAFLDVPGLEFDINLDAIDQFLWLQYIPAPGTVYKNIHKLPPGSYFTISLDGIKKEIKRYWQVEFKPDNTKIESQWLEELDAVLEDSVKAHLVSDVPFAVFLSGGIDSSAILAYMSKILDKPVQAFSISFEEQEYNEIKYAKIAAKINRAEHHVEVVKPDALSILPDLVKHYGEPFGDSSAIPTYYVCKIARKFVPMVLSGDGGDEIFAGYKSYQNWLSWLNEDGLSSSRKIARIFAKKFLPDFYCLHNPRRPTLENWLMFVNYLNIDNRRSLWRKEFNNHVQSSIKVFFDAFSKTKGYSNANVAQYLDINTYLPYDILTKVDVASMMHGLEVRPPIIDVKVAEFAMRIPERLNIRKESGKWNGKILLKKVLEKYYPRDFLNRPKMGFGVPVQKWFASNGILNGYVQDTILNPSSRVYEFFEPNAVKQIVQENAYGRIWLLIFLEEWLKQFQSKILI